VGENPSKKLTGSDAGRGKVETSSEYPTKKKHGGIIKEKNKEYT